MVTPNEVIACNGIFSEVVTVDGYIILGVVRYRPEHTDYPIVIYEDSCCEMIFLSLDDIDSIFCFDGVGSSCCATAPISNPILYATFQNIGGCDCLNNLTVPITFTSGLWRGSANACSGCLITVKVYCLEESDNAFFWGTSIYFDNTTCLAGVGSSNPITCSPFSMMFTSIILDSSVCGCGCSGSVNLLVASTM